MPSPSSTYAAINRQVGRALQRYDMIAPGDRLAVGLSGGKDSMTLLWALTERLARIPIHYDLHAIYIDPGFEGDFGPPLDDFCRSLGVPFTMERTDHGPLAHSSANRENPCFLCSRLRRKRLFQIADSLGCRTLALGHTKDDLIETLFMNICYAGEISTMVPKQGFFDNSFSVVRPLAFVDEASTRRFARQQAFPELVNPCPSAGRTTRQQVKSMLQNLYRSNPKIKGNIFRALSHVRPDYLLT